MNKSIKDYYFIFVNYVERLSPIHKVVFLISCLCILFFISFIPINSPVLYFTDAIYSWNRWAVDWASNKFPYNTAHYPQLFSANLSLCYVFINDTALQFFPKVIMPFFFIGILLIFLDLSFIRKPVVHLTGLILYGCILLVFYSLLFISDCNADIPTAFLGFLAFYTIIRQSYSSAKFGFDSKIIFLVIVFASASANTKMAGSYVLFLSLIWVAFNIYKNWNYVSKIEFIKSILYIMIVIAGSSFWYIIKPVDMYYGLNQSPFLPSSYYERFTNAFIMLFNGFGPPLFLFLFITVLFSLFTKDSKHIVIFIIAPVLFLWTFFFSYDFRNLSIAVPFIAYASAYGIELIYKKIKQSNLLKFSQLNLSKRPATQLPTNTRVRNLLFILLTICTIIIINTDACFNFGIKLSYWFNRAYFHYHRILYTFDHGYYKYVEYFVNTLKVTSCSLLIFFVFRKLRIKVAYVAVAVLAFVIILNFTFLRKENLFNRQSCDLEMMTARNLYYGIYPNIDSHNTNCIGTNYYRFSQLIPPANSQIYYHQHISPATLYNKEDNYSNHYLLLQKNQLSDEAKSNVEQIIFNKNYIVQFDDGEFLLLKAEKKYYKIF